MEIEITRLIENEDPYKYQNSVYNSGLDNIGEITWKNAVDDSSKYMFLDNPDKLSAAIDYFGSFGAWSIEELEAMTDIELNALFIQFVASEYQKLEDYETLEQMKQAFECGEINGTLYPNEDLDRWYFNLSF